MTFEEIKALDHQYVMQSYGRFDVAVDHGRGATLWDTQGREYIDFTSGIGVCSLGYADEGWVNAITEQAGKLGHISNLFYAEPYVKAAEKLCRKAGMSNVFFANSGAESNEGLIKLARKYSFDKYGKGRGTIITLHKSFHGRTITTLSATGQDVFHNYFFPFTEGFRHADANDFDSVEAMAEGLSVDVEALKSTLETYNAAVRGETADEFGRERFFHELAAPFYVMKVSNGVACTTGGLKVDDQMRVLTPAGEPIENLYAIGEISGGYRIHYVGGDSLSHSGISGMLIGQELTTGLSELAPAA